MTTQAEIREWTEKVSKRVFARWIDPTLSSHASETSEEMHGLVAKLKFMVSDLDGMHEEDSKMYQAFALTTLTKNLITVFIEELEQKPIASHAKDCVEEVLQGIFSHLLEPGLGCGRLNESDPDWLDTVEGESSSLEEAWARNLETLA